MLAESKHDSELGLDKSTLTIFTRTEMAWDRKLLLGIDALPFFQV